MKGKVTGLPTKVPRADASKLPLKSHASTKAKMKCNPMNGVKEVNAPAATPAATAWGVAVNRNMRFVTYWLDRSHDRRGQIQTRKLSLHVGGFRLFISIR